MKHQATNHLTDEALDDVLIGLGSVSSLAHLDQCAECRARVEAFRSSVSLFNQASFAWSEAQPVRKQPATLPRHRFFTVPVVAAWAAAAILLVLASPAVWHIFAPHPVQAPAIATTTADYETQIAEDNELLKAVNAAIEPNEQDVIDQYQLLDGQHTQAHP